MVYGGTLIYEPWVEKHKAPMGFGSLCPEVSKDRAQELLHVAVLDPKGTSNALYAIDGEWCFVARPTRVEEGVFHGYPVPGCEVPNRVLRQLEDDGRITRAERIRLRSQRALPDTYKP